MPDYNYLDQLNPQQRAAVEYCDGPSLVIAGAGSGKTRVLTYKIMHLIRSGIEPYRILALTFTNKAAREMKDRVASEVGEQVASRIRMGTFHSVFLRILRQHADRLGFKSAFTIYDTADSRSLIKLIIKEQGLDEKTYKPASVAAQISNAKNALMTPEMYRANYYDSDRKSKRPMISLIFAEYARRCRMANAMDFDDILFYMNVLLRDNEDLLQNYRKYFRYILVDEYQDTNFAQHQVVAQLAKPENRICVVGDDAQSIYSFRGADITNIINLENSLPGLKKFRLERNYRSTQNIVNAADSLIAKNRRQLKKQMYSENEPGAPVEITRAYSDMDEAYIVSNMINGMKLKEHDSYDDYAILYRTNAQSRVLEEALRKRNIGYRIVGGTAFYQRKEIKDMICYFRLTVNPDDDEAMRRIINFPARGIGETTVKRLQEAASKAGVSLWSVIDNLEDHETGVKSGTKKKLEEFASMIRAFISDNEKSDAYSLGQLIFNRTGILLVFSNDSAPENISRKENLLELMTGLKDFVEMRREEGDQPVNMSAFLSEVSLSTDADEKDKTDEPKVTMMTAHAAKGLEFKHVFIVGAEEELFPSALSMDSIADVEEERRLMYVAITRAMKTCVITYAKSRFRNGQTKMTSPSRFLSELDTRYIKRQDGLSVTGGLDLDRPEPSFTGRTYGSMDRFKSVPRNAVSVKNASLSGVKPQHTPDELVPGRKIEHTKFGVGVISKLGQISGEPSITVDFNNAGMKNLLLRYAKFKILN